MGLFLAAVAAASFLRLVPFEGADVAELCPVEILCLEQTAEGIRVTADGGLAASGGDLAQALRHLEEAASGRLLLDTVDQVTLTGLTVTPAALLECGLRPATRVFRSPTVKDADALAAYLARWEGGLTLGRWSESPTAVLPGLVACETGLRMEGES